MTRVIDYFYSHVSPWSFFGHPRLLSIAHRKDVSINFHPITVAEVFPKTGGLPLAKRAPERRAYRMVELKRWSKHLNMPINFEPKYFPVDDRPSLAFALAAAQSGADLGSLSFALMKAVWQDERDISDWSTLAAIGTESGLDGAALVAEAQTDAISAKGLAESELAVQAGCFGVPWYSYKGEGFWGQDRLPLLEEALG
ncbi:MAG: 2-hydroxychromene-2-carboxylate isomerase [Alphaproteobacteria bacterium]|nr:2-hydroxychromene-2-carboxylate isomerase [Alphaproteobacteria bacterium]